jgi:hypothetical protein
MVAVSVTHYTVTMLEHVFKIKDFLIDNFKDQHIYELYSDRFFLSFLIYLRDLRNSLLAKKLRMASNDAKSATIHLACRSDNPKKLIEYQVGENEKPVIVRKYLFCI